MVNDIGLLIDDVLKSCDDITLSITENEIDINVIIQFILLLEKLSGEVDGLQNSELNIDELNEKLSYLLDALKDNDMILFSDNLQYELKPLLEDWKEVI